MNSKEILHSKTGCAVVESINDKIAAKYKILPQDSRGIVENLLLGNKELLAMIAAEKPVRQIAKSKAFKNVQTIARRKVYYHLRQYNRDSDLQDALLEQLDKLPPDTSEEALNTVLLQLAETHVSTRERLGELDFFYTKLFETTGGFESVVDIGCGIGPVTFPFRANSGSLKNYLALEKDAKSVKVLKQFKKWVPDEIAFEAIQWNIGENWFEIMKRYEKPFDVALMLKVIPVIKRNEPELLEILLHTPAKQWVISGSRIAMAKKEDIERRERRILNAFVKDAGKTVVAEFQLKEEFFLVLS